MGLELQEWVCKGTHEHLRALPRNEAEPRCGFVTQLSCLGTGSITTLCYSGSRQTSLK